MMSIGFFNDSWRNTGLMTCSTWENWVVQPLCKLTNLYERITAQSVFGGASAKKCCSCCSRNTHCPSQWLKQPLLVQTDDLCFIWMKVVLQPTVDWWSMLVGWAYLFGIVLWKEVCLGNVPRKGRNTNMNHDFTSFSRWWFDSTHLKTISQLGLFLQGSIWNHQLVTSFATFNSLTWQSKKKNVHWLGSSQKSQITRGPPGHWIG